MCQQVLNTKTSAENMKSKDIISAVKTMSRIRLKHKANKKLYFVYKNKK